MPNATNDIELASNEMTMMSHLLHVYMAIIILLFVDLGMWILVTSNYPVLTGLDHIIEIHYFMPSLQAADVAMPFALFK